MHNRNPQAASAALIALSVIALCVALPQAAIADTAAPSHLPQSVAEATQMERQNSFPLTAFYETPALGASEPGALLREEPTTGYVIPEGASAVRILYHSRAADGSDVATSAVVLIPAGTAPAGGWPVIAWAHGTSGVARMCAPSLMKDVYYGELGLMPMVRAGFAVVATDYHGLGTVGPHQYSSKIAQANDVLYSISAAHAAVSALGRPWVVVGHSQGGLTAWSVAEMQFSRKDPDYRGAVSIAGASDLHEILTNWSTSGKDAAFYMTYMAYAIKAQSLSFAPEQILKGVALEHYADVTTHGCWNYAYATFLKVPAAPVVKAGWDHLPTVERFFSNNQLANAAIGGPLLVVAGEADRTVSIASMRTVVQKACRRGISLEFRIYPGLDHDSVMDRSTPDFLSWIRDRLAGKAVAQGCSESAS